jgi:sugar-phosphatase
MIAHRLECDAVLFDLDGVLIDSTGCILRHWQEWGDRHGITIDKIMQVVHGRITAETIRLVAPHLDAEEEARQFDAQELIDAAGVVAIEGARQILAALPEGAWAIVTSGPLEMVKVRLAKVGLPLPAALVTAGDVRQGKPAPEPYLTGAKRLGVAAGRCIVVEDAPAGIEAGKKAGMQVVGIATTHKREELIANGADFVIDKLENLHFHESADGYRLVIEIEYT